MAEFALVAPFFFLMLFAIIEGGRLVFYYERLNSATREGARFAIVHGSNAGDGCPSGPMPPGLEGDACDVAGDNVREAVRDAALSLAAIGDFQSLDVTWCPRSAPKDCDPQSHNARGEAVTVRAVFSYPPVIAVLPPITIASESTLVINN